MRILGRLLVVLLRVIGFLILVPIAILIIDWAIRSWFPVQSIETRLDKINTTIRLDLYLTSPIGKAEYARRLIVASPQGTASRYMREDWGGATRTSIYLTEANEIAILGPADDDYLVSFNPLRITQDFHLSSDKWEYIGAFDKQRMSSDFSRRKSNGSVSQPWADSMSPALIALNTTRRTATTRVAQRPRAFGRKKARG